MCEYVSNACVRARVSVHTHVCVHDLVGGLKVNQQRGQSSDEVIEHLRRFHVAVECWCANLSHVDTFYISVCISMYDVYPHTLTNDCILI